ncbi:GlxA family transcriptional regulator [Roseovarius albus]|uniref:GlxA family transcriptional regulator n=1 Tax=Roseovarius albus TaxID=1247867 RepID=UPI00135654E6|nr:helix-turn-helix domain-containing protein [Roseovarius albus]
MTEPLRVANRELGRDRFGWDVVSDEGGVVSSSSGIQIETNPLPEDVPEAVILLSSYKPDRAATDPTLAWLRRMDRLGCLMGCVDTGALSFAKAGLLTVRPAATHPESMAGFQRQFPGSLFVDRMADFSPPRFSGAGGVSTLDMTLALIGHFTDERVARRVAEILTYKPPIEGWRPDAIPESIPRAVRDAVSIMDAHLSKCLSVAEIAQRVELPIWKLNRLFQRYLHTSPTSYYVDRRLARARDMLKNTSLPVGEVASDCGYDNAEVFSRAYRLRFEVAPSADRSL